MVNVPYTINSDDANVHGCAFAKTGVNEYAGLLAHLKFDKSARRKDRPALNLRKADIQQRQQQKPSSSPRL